MLVRTTNFPLIVGACAVAWLACAAGSSFAAEADPAFEKRLNEKLFPLVKTYCVDCHSESESTAGVNFAKYDDAESILKDRKVWIRAIDALRKEEMPPEDGMQPSADERMALMEIMHEAAHRIDCSGDPNPGSVTIRRLNRTEYRNTIRDLVGVDYLPADDFPGDDVGYGFDNIGDVLSLPPLLLEKYLAAAQEISERAIAVPLPAGAPVIRVAGKDFRGKGGSRRDDGGIVFASDGSASYEFEIPARGKYELRFRAFGDQAGDEAPKLEVKVADRTFANFSVRAEEDAPDYYSKEWAAPAGKFRVTIGFHNDFYEEKGADGKQHDRNLHVLGAELVTLEPAMPAKLPESHAKIVFVRPGKDVSDVQAAAQVLRRLASRAYRRPVEGEELRRLAQLCLAEAEREGSFEAGVRLAMQAILVSPHFLYKLEQPAPPGQTRTLSDYELAVNLSYFLWSSMPDDELLYHAFQGTLRKDGNLDKQVRRMLADPKAEALVEQFAFQWLNLRPLDEMTLDNDLFPDFDDELKKSMKEETRLFVESIFREDRPATDLLAADYTYVNEDLAKHYGIPDVKGDEFRRMQVAQYGRGGLLSQASVLTVTSNPSRTSPVKRGKWILENLLNSPPPPPAPDVPTLERQTELKGTLRERMEQHRADPNCATCHKVMDPLGFALENYDASGRWREEDEGLPIVAKAELPSGESFGNAVELQNILAQSQREAFLRCMIEKMLTYALGRGVEYYDQCSIDAIYDQAVAEDGRVSAIVLGVVNSEPFQKRRGEGTP
jgi:hypothetical protein